jgi:hypothetical protein
MPKGPLAPCELLRIVRDGATLLADDPLTAVGPKMLTAFVVLLTT